MNDNLILDLVSSFYYVPNTCLPGTKQLCNSVVVSLTLFVDIRALFSHQNASPILSNPHVVAMPWFCVVAILIINCSFSKEKIKKTHNDDGGGTLVVMHSVLISLPEKFLIVWGDGRCKKFFKNINGTELLYTTGIVHWRRMLAVYTGTIPQSAVG